jgi:hypothetical protein
MTHEHSLHSVIQGLLLLALLWETWAGYTWLALATLLTWLPKRAVRHDLGGYPTQSTRFGIWCSGRSGPGERPVARLRVWRRRPETATTLRPCHP